MPYTTGSFTYTQDLTADNTKQLVDIMTPVFDGDMPHQRKDTSSLKLKIYTGGDIVDVFVYTDNQEDPTFGPIYIASIQSDMQVKDVLLDLSEIIGVCKWFQVRIIGIVSDFNLAEMAIEFSPRPVQTTFIKVNLMDLGIVSPNKKRMRVWPITVDILDGELADIVPYIDGVAQPALTIQNEQDDYPMTHFYHFTTDALGIDFALAIHSCCAMEIYKVHQPIGVQILPVTKRFDQVGPEEFFRYGKIRKLICRILAFGGTVIPFKIYFQDMEAYTGNLTVVDGKEDNYEIDVPQTVAGQITRIEFGPTNFDFHRYYIRAKVAKAGKDTEVEWVGLTDGYDKMQGGG